MQSFGRQTRRKSAPLLLAGAVALIGRCSRHMGTIAPVRARTAYANHGQAPNPPTDGTTRAGPRAVVAVRRENAGAAPAFRKKLQLRRVQRSNLGGPISEPVRKPRLLSFQWM
jgi:hypothetical protein